jgi:hypothetical protein
VLKLAWEGVVGVANAFIDVAGQIIRLAWDAVMGPHRAVLITYPDRTELSAGSDRIAASRLLGPTA